MRRAICGFLIEINLDEAATVGLHHCLVQIESGYTPHPLPSWNHDVSKKFPAKSACQRAEVSKSVKQRSYIPDYSGWLPRCAGLRYSLCWDNDDSE